MAQKPPAFPLYVKDWKSSPMVRTMSAADRGNFVELLCTAWDSEIPGTLPKNTLDISRQSGIDPRAVRNFIEKYPAAFVDLEANYELPSPQLGANYTIAIAHLRDTYALGPDELTDRLVNLKLYSIWLRHRFISTKRKKAAEQSHANAKQVQCLAVAVAPAVALAPKRENLNTPPTPPQERGESQVFWWGREVIRVWPGRRKRLWTDRDREALAGSRAPQVVAWFEGRGMHAEVVDPAEYSTSPSEVPN